ncbi:MAG TPA: type VI secretion system baseplate subunit TssG [Chitinivibrionales bacterium]|nr:type VI secretion system baseplate subunit TssG [Chitinivibrionales bacterium]
MADLIQRLCDEGHNFNFFQALSLLEEKYRTEQGMARPVESGMVRLVPDASLSFPAGDISAVRTTKQGIEFVLSFMGLIGVSSPLPLYFTEYIARHEDTSEPLRDFLALFNHRLYSLFYRAWQKYRFVSMAAGGLSASPMAQRIASLAGIGRDMLGDPFYSRLLAYTGSLAGRVRSKDALRAMLSDFLGGLPVALCEWQPRWTEIRNPPRLGVDSRLGTSAMLGTRTWDLSGKFRVSIGPLSRGTFETFLPGSENISALKKLVTLFISDPLEFDIEVKLESSELVPVILGKDNSRLGETSSLGESVMKSDIQAIVIQ